MRRFSLLACAIVCASSASVWADVPLPKDLKYVDPRVRFEGIDKHADYVFHLRFQTFSGNPASVPPTMIEVKDAKPFNLNAQRRLINMTLLALERKDFERRKQEDPSLKWLNEKTEGILRVTMQTPKTVLPVTVKEVPVTEYRVAIKDGKLTADMAKAAKTDKTSEATPDGLLPPWMFGVVAAMSLGFLGVWYARRRKE